MKKLIIIGIGIIALVGAIFLDNLIDKCPSIDSWQITIPYCEHMGYTMEINENDRAICVFDDGTSCRTDDFYLSTTNNTLFRLNNYSEVTSPSKYCGQDKVREFRKRKECEDVYIKFEECEEGLILSEPRYLLAQPHCREKNWWEIMKLTWE